MSDVSQTTIGDLVKAGALELGDGYRTKRAELASEGYRIIRVADVGDGLVRLTSPDFVSADHERAIGSKAGRSGDVLLTTKGTVGRVAIVPAVSERIVYSPQLCYFRVVEPSRLEARFLAFWFKSAEFWNQASHLMSNTDMAPYINLADIRSLRINLPELTEQRAIAEVLGALDDKIAANSRLSATAESLASAIYADGVKGLPMRSMSSVLRPVLGGTPARAREDYWGGSRPWISARDITGAPNHTVVDTEEKITDVAVESTKAKPLPVGSVVLTARGTVGAVARLAEPASFNQSCYGFAPGKLPSSLLYFAVLGATERAKAMAHGSVFDTITMSTFDHLDIPEPTPDQVIQLESRLSPLLNTVTAAIRENRTLAATRDALLPQLMSGKLRVKDAESLVADTV